MIIGGREASGLDEAIVLELDERMAQTFDAGLISAEMLRTTIAVRNDVMKGGPIYKYLHSCSQEAIAAVQRFARLDPTKIGEIIECQRAIERYIHLNDWLKITIAAGIRPPDNGDADSEAEEM